ncbi:hypothetical protein K470DRAFT_260957 [Piedraia hortae CBS 480.64]|uniref:Uncharacterized protein n=1 Tax=Piedraia hortae CBS 480.64 TaxID=1314780 RepID=A0A6A7BPP7_9PEZI|nr:hypothetical protein K470DRAFT_260957 [Piedraia hortae CBS 480.64]
MDTRAKEDVEFVPEDGTPFHEDFGPFLRAPYPAKKFCMKHDAYAVQININFWQGGVTAVQEKRWNALEVWIMKLTGFSRRHNFHVSANYYVAAGAKMKATSMLRGLMLDLVRSIPGFYLRDAPFPLSGSD